MSWDHNSKLSSLLRGLVEVSRLRASDVDELSQLFAKLATTLSETLGLGVVVINVYRPAWDDFIVGAVHGSEQARSALLGATYPWSAWKTLLDERFNVGGAYFIPEGALELDIGARYVPERTEAEPDEGAWLPGDELSVPVRCSDGRLVAILNVGEPISGRRMSGAEIDVLVVAAEHAGLTIEAAQQARDARTQRDALSELLRLSADLASLPRDDVLQRVCEGVRSALGFRHVSLELVDDAAGVYRPRALVSLLDGAVQPTKLGWLLPLLDERFDHNGCYLVPSADARLLVDVDHSPYASRNNGIGPHAWSRHWLLVPMYGRNGEMLGVLWADEPADRLVPPAWKLDALRLFADQAASAVVAAGERAQLTFLADHDPLTGLLNRRAFNREVARETARSERTGVPFGLILLDLVAFKVLNDTLGHVAGDAALCRVGDALRCELRADDLAFRLGGDEFAIVLGATTDEGGVELAARRLCARLTARIEGVSASFGHAVWSHGRSAEHLVHEADEVLYTGRGMRRPLSA